MNLRTDDTPAVQLVRALLANAVEDIFDRWAAGERESTHPNPVIRGVENACFRELDAIVYGD